MKIYTKKGDSGTTALMDGKVVRKNNLSIIACGEIDELNAFVGWAKSTISDKKIQQQLLQIQKELFVVGASVADVHQKTGVKITLEKIKTIENFIDEMDEELPLLKHFILPGGSEKVSLLHVCRAVCRRAERALSALNEKQNLPKENLQYINRLSDYFFVLARFVAQQNNESEEKWIP